MRLTKRGTEHASDHQCSSAPISAHQCSSVLISAFISTHQRPSLWIPGGERQLNVRTMRVRELGRCIEAALRYERLRDREDGGEMRGVRGARRRRCHLLASEQRRGRGGGSGSSGSGCDGGGGGGGGVGGEGGRGAVMGAEVFGGASLR